MRRDGPSPDYLPTAAPAARLIEELHRLPGIGPKSAQRLTYHLIRLSPEDAKELAEAIIAVKEQVSLCSVCFNITDQVPCRLCSDPSRDRTLLCAVEEPLDVLALERTRAFHGLYHVLHGAISPMNGVGPDDLRVKELLERLRAAPEGSADAAGPEVQEVILATNPTLEGEATSMYLHRLLTPLGVRVTRLARGLPTGTELEYADETTLVRALQGRQPI